jgi:hypothetical protein
MKNKIFAIPADAPAIPPKPKAPATRATIKNTRAQYSMVASPFRAANNSAACVLAAKHKQRGEVPWQQDDARPAGGFLPELGLQTHKLPSRDRE